MTADRVIALYLPQWKGRRAHHQQGLILTVPDVKQVATVLAHLVELAGNHS